MPRLNVRSLQVTERLAAPPDTPPARLPRRGAAATTSEIHGRGCQTPSAPAQNRPAPARPGSSPQAARGRLPAGAAPPPAGQYGGGGGVRGAVSRCPLRASLLGAAATAAFPLRPPALLCPALPSALAMGPAGPAGRVWARCPCGCPGEAGSEREDAAVVGAAHILHALLPARRRHDGHGAHLRAGLGRLAPALRRPPRPLLPRGGRPSVHHLPEHGALLLRELRGRAGEPVARRGASPRRPVGSGGRQSWARPVPRVSRAAPAPGAAPGVGRKRAAAVCRCGLRPFPAHVNARRAEALGAPRRVVPVSRLSPSDAFRRVSVMCSFYRLEAEGTWHQSCAVSARLAALLHAWTMRPALRIHGATLVVDKNVTDCNCTSSIYITLLHLPTSVIVYLLSGLGLCFWLSHGLWLFSTSESRARRLRSRRQSWQSVLPYQRVWVQVIMLRFTIFSSHVKWL